MTTNATSVAETVTPAKTEPAAYAFAAADRCDRCGAQAYVAAQFGDTVLLFCAHHAREHKDQIADHIIGDNRAALTQRPSYMDS